MDEEEWGKLALFIWLSAYIVFFAVACVMIQKRSTAPRFLFFIGTLMLLLVNIALLAEFLEITSMQYNPIYEDARFSGSGFGHYPAWQRLYWWTISGMDFLGKILSGIGLIMEARRLMTAYRFSEMQKYQPQIQQPNPNFPTQAP